MAIESYGPGADDALVAPYENDDYAEFDGAISHGGDTFGDFKRAAVKTPLLESKEQVAELSKKIEIGIFAGRILAVREAEDSEEMLGQIHQQVMSAAVQKLRGATNTRSKAADEKGDGAIQPQVRRKVGELTDDELYIARHDADMGVMRIAKYAADESVTSDELQLLADEGAEARNHLVQANLRLVIAIAKRYRARAKTMDYVDLVQEGNRGLIKAVDMFDHTKGYAFSTYATNWIHQAIQLSLADQSRTIRLPKDMNNKLHTKIIPERDKLIDELGREPTDAELAAQTGLSVEEAQYLRPHVHNLMSMDMKIRAEGDTTLADLLVNDGEPSALDYVSAKELPRAVDALLGTLDERSAQILRLRFGIGCQPHTIEQAAEVLGVNDSFISRWQKTALTKLLKTKGIDEIALMRPGV